MKKLLKYLEMMTTQQETFHQIYYRLIGIDLSRPTN